MNTASRVVVIAAAQGGEEALSRVLSSLPYDFPAAMIAVVHTNRADGIELPDQLRLRIHRIQEGDDLVDGKLFMASDLSQPVIRSDGGLGLNLHEKPSMFAADDLFISAARVYGQRLIGVVLSGEGRDGSTGMIAIARHGGKSIVQSPSDAQVPGMPISAIVRDSPDHVVLLEEIGPLLKQLVSK